MENYDRIEFNKALFVRNDDNAYKMAVMFSRYPEISKERQEILFFANKNIIKNKFNPLAYSELFNEAIRYSNNWLLELDTLKDEFDWEIHRTKILTCFGLKNTIDSKDEISKFMKANGHEREANIIYNTAVAWNNAIYFARNDKYKDTSDSRTWELWEIINQYKDGNLDAITGDKKHIKELNKIVNYRKNEKFFTEQLIGLTPQELKLIEELEKSLSTIFLKEELKKEIPIISSIRKRLKL
jgi:hypothetical protein